MALESDQSLGTAATQLAVHIELLASCQLAHPLDRGAALDLIEGDQLSPGDGGDLGLGRIAHIHQHQAAGVAIEQRLQLTHADALDRAGLLLARGAAAHATELLVVDQFLDHRSLGVGPELQLAETHLEGIKQQQSPTEGGADAGDDLDGLRGLNHADDPGQHAHHAALGAGGHHARRRRLGKQIAVVGACGIQVEHGGLAFEAEDRAVDVGLAQQHTGVVDQVAGRKVVRAVADNVVGTHDVESVLARERRFVEIHLAVGIDLEDARLGRFDLGLADPAGAMDHLPLQIAVIDDVEVDNAKATHACSGQIQQQG